jgi:undecaprenyl-diphosphatase
MDWLQSLILGLLQGLTEYLPVSSSGHLAIGQAIFGLENGEDNLMFTVAVHVATVLSTLVVLRKEIAWLLKGLFVSQTVEGKPVAFFDKDATRYLLNILVSMIPVGIVGLFFKDKVEEIFGSGLLIVGCSLLLTAVLLIFSFIAQPRQKTRISLRDAFVIGIAQACAVLPGLSRSGSTIATGLLLGNSKETLAKFSFLMVIPPILGEALLDVLKAMKGEAVMGDIQLVPLLVGFLAAFISGCFACKWMIDLVKRGKLIYFGFYCALIGVGTILYSLLG